MTHQYYLCQKKKFIICIRVTLPDPTVAASDVLGTGIIH